MTQKDFELIAEQVAASVVTACLTDLQREDLALNFAGALRRTNERFDVSRFLAAATGVAEVGDDLFAEARRSNLV